MVDDDVAGKGDNFAAIGRELFKISGGMREVFLYAEAGDGWVDTSIYVVKDDEICWVDSAGDIAEPILEAWACYPAEKRWSAMIYEISGSEFTADLLYEDDLDPSDDVADRRERALRERYGDRPIIYADL